MDGLAETAGKEDKGVPAEKGKPPYFANHLDTTEMQQAIADKLSKKTSDENIAIHEEVT